MAMVYYEHPNFTSILSKLLSLKVGIVGGSGLVGSTMCKVILQDPIFKTKVSGITLFSSSKSAGSVVKVCGEEFTLEVATLDNLLKMVYMHVLK